MPTFVYGCGVDGTFEAQAGRDDSSLPCPVCRQPARRRPYSSVPYLKGETVARSIPDPQYRHEAVKREFNDSWGDASRSVEMLRKSSFTDAEGAKHIDLKGMTQ